MSTLSIIVGTFGDMKWTTTAAERALPSAWSQANPEAQEVIHVHGRSLAAARNAGARAATGEWLVFLDADDELAPGYVAAMLNGKGDLRQPATSFDGAPASCLPAIDLRGGNFLVIGTAIRKVLFNAVGGFFDEECFEDYSLWLRCAGRGAWIFPTPDAIYKVHSNPESRNNGDYRRWDVMRDIIARYGSPGSVDTIDS